jgi:hypothetical protein
MSHPEHETLILPGPKAASGAGALLTATDAHPMKRPTAAFVGRNVGETDAKSRKRRMPDTSPEATK